jgi:hypothetical protein
MTFLLDSDIGRPTGRLRTNATSQRRHDGGRSTAERIRSERGRAKGARGSRDTRVAMGDPAVVVELVNGLRVERST